RTPRSPGSGRCSTSTRSSRRTSGITSSWATISARSRATSVTTRSRSCSARRGLEGAANAYAACALTGTPDQIIAKLAGIKEVLGSFELTILPSFGGMPYDQAEQSLELFAQEVLPAARQIQG